MPATPARTTTLFLSLLSLFLKTTFAKPVPPILPPPSYPSNTLNDAIDTCPTYAACSANGQSSYTTLLHLTSQTPPPPDRPSTFPAFQQWYETDTVPLGPYGRRIRQDLANHGLDWQSMVLYASTSKDADGELAIDSAYGNIVDPVQGIVIAIENFRQFDTSVVQLPWSEIVYNTWTHVARPTPAGLATLRYSVQHNVDNEPTKRILRLMYAEMGFPAPGTGDGEWRAWTREREETRNWFWALLGTDTCKGTMWLLRDHHVEAGGKVVRTVWTRWAGVYPDIWMDVG
ncbi:MAG: hypothetical protein Q9176_004038 [Flavoplaca citrina]